MLYDGLTLVIDDFEFSKNAVEQLFPQKIPIGFQNSEYLDLATAYIDKYHNKAAADFPWHGRVTVG